MMNLSFCTLEVEMVQVHFFVLPSRCHYVNVFQKKHPERAGQLLLPTSSNLLRKERCQIPLKLNFSKPLLSASVQLRELRS